MANAFGLHDLMMSFSAERGGESNSNADTVNLDDGGDSAATPPTAGSFQFSASSSAEVVAPDVASSAPLSKPKLPAHLKEAQRYVHFEVEAHNDFSDPGGHTILDDIATYARTIYEPPEDNDPESYRRLRCIPRISVEDRHLFEAALHFQIPVILTNSKLVSQSCSRWTPEYLEKKFGDARKMTVFQSRSPYFRYWSTTHHRGSTLPFQAPTESLKITFPEFLRRCEATQAKQGNAETKHGGGNAAEPVTSREHLYLQEGLSGHPELASDFKSWDWSWLLAVVRKFGWGNPDTNSLFVGMEGHTTPVHFDDQENIFCQIQGSKEVFVYPPSDFRAFYPFPVNHACDRQSMVNVDDPDLQRFPNHRFARPHWAMLKAGETMYLPGQWWHHFRNREDYSMSVTFWSKQKPFDMSQFSIPLGEKQLFCVRRNVEDLVMKKVGADRLDNVFAGVYLQLADELQVAPSQRSAVVVEPADHATCQAVYALMRSLLLQVLNPENVDQFILQSIEGRYGTGDTSHWLIPTTTSTSTPSSGAAGDGVQ